MFKTHIIIYADINFKSITFRYCVRKMYKLYLYFKLVSVLNYWYSWPTPIKILYIMYNINVKVKIVLYHFESV